jgi:zinc protease
MRYGLMIGLLYWGATASVSAAAITVAEPMAAAAIEQGEQSEQVAGPITHDFTLDNGLRVLLREDHRAPVAVSMLWYKVGSYDEAPGETGLAHLLEHMMFRGSEKLPPGDFSRLVARFGGEDNAFTSYDFTAYFQKVEVSRLPLMLELEADRMRNLTISDEDFVREREVVMEERRQRTDDNPSALAWEKFTAILRPGSGYASPVIGWREELQNLAPEQARVWYNTWYVPENATLVIAGDISRETVEPLVRRFFGKIKGAAAPPRQAPRLSYPPGERRVVIEAPVQVPSLYLAYNVPTLATHPKDFYALTMLSGVLDGGYSARIESDLVRGQKILAGGGAGYDGLSRADGLLTLSATPAQGVSLAQAEQALEVELDKLRTTEPSAAEMARVRAGVLSGRVFGMDSLFGQAMELGQLVTLGIDWRMGDQFAERLAEVTPADVQRVAKQWLVPQRRAVAHIVAPAADDTGASVSQNAAAREKK